MFSIYYAVPPAAILSNNSFSRASISSSALDLIGISFGLQRTWFATWSNSVGSMARRLVLGSMALRLARRASRVSVEELLQGWEQRFCAG